MSIRSLLVIVNKGLTKHPLDGFWLRDGMGSNSLNALLGCTKEVKEMKVEFELSVSIISFECALSLVAMGLDWS